MSALWQHKTSMNINLSPCMCLCDCSKTINSRWHHLLWPILGGYNDFPHLMLLNGNQHTQFSSYSNTKEVLIISEQQGLSLSEETDCRWRQCILELTFTASHGPVMSQDTLQLILLCSAVSLLLQQSIPWYLYIIFYNRNLLNLYNVYANAIAKLLSDPSKIHIYDRVGNTEQIVT